MSSGSVRSFANFTRCSRVHWLAPDRHALPSGTTWSICALLLIVTMTPS